LEYALSATLNIVQLQAVCSWSSKW